MKETSLYVKYSVVWKEPFILAEKNNMQNYMIWNPVENVYLYFLYVCYKMS